MQVDEAVQYLITQFNGREITNMPTDAQIKFFDKLLEEKDFGAADIAALKQQFAGLNKVSASVWIEKGIGLPKRDESTDVVVPPAF